MEMPSLYHMHKDWDALVRFYVFMGGKSLNDNRRWKRNANLADTTSTNTTNRKILSLSDDVVNEIFIQMMVIGISLEEVYLSKRKGQVIATVGMFQTVG